MYMEGLPLKERVNVQALIQRIESGSFDANDIDTLLVKLRPYAARKRVFREVANFAAHADLRNRGLACDSMTCLADGARLLFQYDPRQKLDLTKPFPVYIRRLWRTHTEMANEGDLKPGMAP
jgi:hypothetical protein